MKRWIAGLALAALITAIAPQAHAQDPAAATATSTITATGTATTPAPETDLADVTITPDSIFYSLKLFVERLRTAITLDAAERAALLTQQATTRLAEAKLMMEAGKSDLAETALKESQQKFRQAQSVVAGAVAAGRQLDSLQAQLESNEAKFTLAMDQILLKAPLESRTQVAAAVTDVKVQLAATRDSVVPDPKLTAAAQHLITALQTQTAETAQALPLPPRVLLALEAISKESGVPLAEVLALYQQRRALGDLALELKVKLESVQDGARLTLKIDGDELEMEMKEADGTKTEITLKNGEMKVKVEEEEEDDDEDKRDRKVKLEFKEKKEKREKKGCKEHPVFKEHPGKGKGKGLRCEDRDEDRDED